MGSDGAPTDGDDGPGAPGTDTGAGQTANVTFGAESSHRLAVPGFLRALNMSNLGDVNSQSSSDEASPPPPQDDVEGTDMTEDQMQLQTLLYEATDIQEDTICLRLQQQQPTAR